MAANKKRIVAGVFGGALGGFAMKAVVRLWDPNAFGLSSRTDATAARAVFGEGLEQRRAEWIGSAMHYGFGIVTGMGYAVASDRFPVLRIGRGTVFGGGLWLIGDELAVTAARLENPGAASAVSHLAALAAHMTYGLIVDACVSKSEQLVATAAQNPEQDV